MKNLVFINAHVVTPEGVVDGDLRIEDGRIVAVEASGSRSRAKGGNIDCEGDYLIPGLVELHTDNLEKHLMPRPSVLWPSAESAFLAHDAQIAASGITTVFDSLCVGETQSKNRRAMLKLAFDAFHAAGDALPLRADHKLHLRCELSDPEMWDMFEPVAASPALGLVSLMDHTPGQRQWMSADAYRIYYSDTKSWTDAEFAAMVEEYNIMRERHVPGHGARLAAWCRENGLPMASHDDTLPEHVDEALERGMRISEFPTTLEAARRAHESGMTVLMGSPNIVRGGSHSGNVSAMAVARAGCLGGLSSDYVPASLLPGAFSLYRQAGMSLHEAVNMVTANPAEAAGLGDRGKLEPGLRADVVRVRPHGDLPVVRAVWREGERVF